MTFWNFTQNYRLLKFSTGENYGNQKSQKQKSYFFKLYAPEWIQQSIIEVKSYSDV